MKYVKKIGPNSNNMPEDFVTETVDEASFSPAHEALGSWELVSDEEAERLRTLELLPPPIPSDEERAARILVRARMRARNV